MRLRIAPLIAAGLAALALACGEGPGLARPPTEAPAAAPPPGAPSPAPTVERRDIQATRLVVPSLQIDEAVQTSRTVPYTYTPPPGCPPRPQDTQTLTVPDQGIATPAENLEGVENKAWIFGHSRWQGRSGVFLRLQGIRPGDELFVDGRDRANGERLMGLRFVVEAIYLTDLDSGERLINAARPEDIPPAPLVILQTSVREDGHGKPWILDQREVLSKAVNLVEGDLDDPCKYLLLFVFARPG
jgi:hypothetical protein